jgi:4-amino-4-deoxy-L-arabinose transferase-like glycosyltransferase
MHEAVPDCTGKRGAVCSDRRRPVEIAFRIGHAAPVPSLPSRRVAPSTTRAVSNAGSRRSRSVTSELTDSRVAALPARGVVVLAAWAGWLPAVGLAVAVVVGAAVRLVGVGDIGFNSDEAVYAGQAAALAGNADYAQFFAIFRAHPLLVQFLLSVVFHFGVSDVAARLLSVVIGLAAIPLIYLLGAELYSRRVGVVSAAVLAVLPYHVVVSRQVLLDGPVTTLFLLSMLLLARYVTSQRPGYLYMSAVAGGLTFLAKETAILILPVGAAFILMTPEVRLGRRRLLKALGAFMLAASPYPISIVVSGASGTAKNFLIWQLLRRPNHGFTFYAEILPGALGISLLLLAIIGIVIAVRRATWQDRLLLAWVLVPLIFYQVWPVKGYQYLLPIVPALIVLSARLVELMPAAGAAIRSRRPNLGFRAVAVTRAGAGALALLLILPLAFSSLTQVGVQGAVGSLAGTGGLPGGREAGGWIERHVPEGGAFMTIGPTLSNLIQFYGHRRSQGLSVSPNPLNRNPAYDPIINPDYSIRTLRIQYVGWDLWSASRSPFFERLLMKYVSKYHGRLVYEQIEDTRNIDGSISKRAVIRIYEVRP